jgi:hypothetical protein
MPTVVAPQSQGKQIQISMSADQYEHYLKLVSQNPPVASTSQKIQIEAEMDLHSRVNQESDSMKNDQMMPSSVVTSKDSTVVTAQSSETSHEHA